MDTIVVAPGALSESTMYFVDEQDRPLPCYIGSDRVWVDAASVMRAGGSFSFYVVWA